MATNIDDLQIEISASATKANNEIDKLISRLGKLSTSLSSINGSSITGLANGVQRLGTAMQNMSNVKTADFSRLAKNITKLGSLDTSALNRTASSMSQITRSFNQLGSVSSNAVQVGELAKSISKLGNKGVQNAITNIPQLATAMKQLMTTLSTAPTVSSNIIQMTNALANLASQGSKVGSVSKNLVGGMNKTHTSMNRTAKSTKSLAYAFGKFYANYFLFVRAFKGLFNSIESTADYIEAFNYFNVAIGKIASEWSHDYEKYGYENAEAYAESFNQRLTQALSGLSGVQVSIGADGSGLLTETGMKNLGLNIKEVTQYASQLASVTNSVGQTGEVSLAAAEAFTKLGADISSLFNLDYSAVMGNLQSGLIGQSRALYKYGIDITNATLQTYAYGLGLEKAVSEMTQAEKMQLRMIAILDQSRVAWSDLSNTLNSPSNLIRQFTNNLKEAGMVLGQLFMPLLQKVLPVINGVTIAIKRLLVSIAGFLGISLDLSSFGQGYSDMADDAGDLSDSLDDAAASAKKLKTATLGIDELNINAPQDDTSGVSGAVGGGIDLTDEILAATDEYQKVWQEAFDKMESRAQAFADTFEKIFEPIRNIIEDISYGIKFDDESWFKVAGMDLAGIFNGLFSDENFNSLGQTIADGLNKAFSFALGFSEGFEWSKVGSSLVSGLKGFFTTWDAGLTAETFSSFANGILEAMTSAVDSLSDSNLFADIGQKLVDFVIGIDWKQLNWNFYNFFSSLSDALIDLPLDFATGVLEGIMSKVFGIENFKFEIPEGIKETIKNTLLQAFPQAMIFNNLLNVGEFVENLTTWWSEISPWFAIEKWEERLDGIKKAFTLIWAAIVLWWNNTALKQWWDKSVTPWFTKKKWEDALAGIKQGFESVWDGAIQSIKNIWNRFANWLNEKLTINIDTSTLIGKGIANLLGTSTLKLANLPTYQTGGFPEDGLFMANRNELVGQFSNGRTAVANNEQIVAGIKEGVREAVSEILAPYLSDIAQNTRETADKDFSVNIGDRDIARANARGQRSLGYSLVT